MHRVENYYHWKTLEHWKIAMEAGDVQMKAAEGEEITDDILGKALSLLENNCFPVSLICYRDTEDQKVVFLTPLWAGVFKFLNNERCVQREEQRVRFQEMTDDEQKAILGAWIGSIWIREGFPVQDMA